MLYALRSFVRLSWIGRVAAVPVFVAVLFLALSVAGVFLPPCLGAQASPAPAHEAGQTQCPPSAILDIPLTSTIQARVVGTMDPGRLKVGKEVWVKVENGLVYPACTLNAGAAIYGRVTAAVAGKSPTPSELSLAFDRADCEGHPKQAMPLRLIGLIGPEEMSLRMHDIVPTPMKGAQRSSPNAAQATAFRDDKLNPGGPPETVHIGVVLGLPKLQLDYEGGPGCSARIFSPESGLQLVPGSELILIVQSTP
ncbi:MAG: hypothetical protein ABR898_01425 [Terracidiphilus sp.]|jgi:hypothetical protein